MANQINLERVLELVEFELHSEGWRVKNVEGDVCGDVCGDVMGSVRVNVGGTINGRQWKFAETPKEELKRLVKEGADKETLLATIDRLENSNG